MIHNKKPYTKVEYYSCNPMLFRLNLLKLPEISAKAKVIILLCIDIEQLSISEISSLMKEGKESITSAIKELEYLDLIEKKIIRKNGKIVKWFVYLNIENIINLL